MSRKDWINIGLIIVILCFWIKLVAIVAEQDRAKVIKHFQNSH